MIITRTMAEQERKSALVHSPPTNVSAERNNQGQESPTTTRKVRSATHQVSCGFRYQKGSYCNYIVIS